MPGIVASFPEKVAFRVSDHLVEKVSEFVENGTTKARYKKTGTVML